MLKAGKLDGTLIMVEYDEIADLLLITDIYNVMRGCLMTRKENPWTFAGIDSLLPLRLGLVQDYGYPPTIAGYIEQYGHDDSKIDFIATEKAQLQNLKKLLAGRIDATYDDCGVLRWIAQQQKQTDRVKIVGCLPAETVRGYISISKNSPQAQEYVEKINTGYAALKKAGRVQQLLKKYALEQNGSGEKTTEKERE